jgi:hypothetical protein
MSDATTPAQPASPLPANPATVSQPAGAGLDRAAFFSALGNPLRWQMVKMLADGSALSASQFASALKRDFDGVSKHLRILREAGVLAWRAGEDRRLALYHIPEAARRVDGALDYGFCVIRAE